MVFLLALQRRVTILTEIVFEERDIIRERKKEKNKQRKE
jgi:hypothetical protein